MEKITQEELAARIANAMVVFFYKTDSKLDESDLDTFHDKSLVRQEAETYAKEMTKAITGFEITN